MTDSICNKDSVHDKIDPEIIIDDSDNSKEPENTLLKVISHNESLITQPEKNDSDNPHSYGSFEPIGRSSLIIPISLDDHSFTAPLPHAKETICDDKDKFGELCTQSQMTCSSARNVIGEQCSDDHPFSNKGKWTVYLSIELLALYKF